MAGVAPPPAGQTVELPDEIVKLVGDLAAKAAAKPDDLSLWTHLGEVYSRTAQFDDGYYPKALEAFDHVLERDPKRADAIRGKANVHYDRNEPKQAIPLYERYLALRGDDASVETDLATMHFYDGDTEKAIGMYQAVLKKDPHFVQAHYNLAAAYHRQGNLNGALDELRTARSLATDDRVKEQIDQMIARLSGAPPPAAGGAAAPAPAPAAADEARTPFQREVEAQLRAHQILGPRIVALRWKSAGEVEARMREFPMAQMPPMAREAFEKRVKGYLTDARRDHPVDGPVSLTLADAASGDVMATVTP
jgi:tetratricopeptide (TPR) repeat protein